MGFMVCHMEKFSAKDVRGIEIHNERKTQNSKNKDIDYERTGLNLELHDQIGDTYTKKINGIVENGYTSSRKIREDTVKMVSFVVSASPDYLKNLEKSEQDRYFKESYNYLAEKVGKSNVISSKVHYDEGTPHMHFCAVPLTQDGRLSAKELFDRKALQEIQNDMFNHLKNKGFKLEKGLKKEKTPHKDFHEWKKENLSKIEKVQISLEKFNSQTYDRELKGILNKPTGNYIVPEENLKQLRGLARQGILIKDEIRELKKTVGNKDKEVLEYQEKYVDQIEKWLELNKITKKYKKISAYAKEQIPEYNSKIKEFINSPEFENWKSKEQLEKEQAKELEKQSKSRSKGFER